MSRILLLIQFAISYSAFAQNDSLLLINVKIDNLDLLISNNEQQIKNLQDRNVDLIGARNALITRRNALMMKSGDGIIYVCIIGSCIYDKQYGGKVLSSVKRGDKLKLLESNGDYYFVFFNGLNGWIHKAALANEIEVNKEIQRKEELARKNKIIKDSIYQVRLSNAKQRQEEEYLNEQKLEKERQIAATKRKNNLINKYGSNNGVRIFEGKIWIGMTKEMLLESWSNPKEINRTVGSWGVNEQRVYSGTYVYLENDVLKSWQD